MSAPGEAIEKIKADLEPYIKPREQVNYIRRIIALHLAACSQDAPANQPLVLAGTSRDIIAPSPSAKGLHREYFEALKANVAAKIDLDDVVQQRPATPERVPPPPLDHINPLEERVATLKLEEKKRKLSIVRKYLDQLVDQPAASSAFLDTDEIFRGCPRLPSVPQDFLEDLASTGDGAGTDLWSQAQRLEKIVLRSKLQLRQEERLLQEAKERSRDRPDVISNGAKLEALSATRNELITWIETELSTASANESRQVDDGRTGRGEADQATINHGLSDIKQKYEKYLAQRTRLLELAQHQPQISTKPELKPKEARSTTKPPTQPVNHLLIPYIERLLALSRAQRSSIAHKSHLNAMLSKQTKDACQSLGHLAEESQLLPAYPMKDSQRRRSGLIDDIMTKKTDTPDITKRIKPWIFASDSAKIVNLEAVAETMEAGQLGLEGSIKAISELERLLGMARVEEEVEAKDGLAEGNVSGADKRQVKPENGTGDIWSILRGNLGLIGQEDCI